MSGVPRRVTGTTWGYHIFCGSVSSSLKATSVLIEQSIKSLSSDLSIEKRILQTHHLHLQSQTFLFPLEGTRGHGSDRAPPNKERAGKIPASSYFSKCPLVDFHRRSALAPHRPPITAAVSLSVCALIGLPRSRSAPEAATGSRRIRVLKNAGSESAKLAFRTQDGAGSGGARGGDAPEPSPDASLYPPTLKADKAPRGRDPPRPPWTRPAGAASPVPPGGDPRARPPAPAGGAPQVTSRAPFPPRQPP